MRVIDLVATLCEELLVTLFPMLFPTKSPVASAVFFNFLFLKQFLSASVADFVFCNQKSFYSHFLLKFLPIFLAKDGNP